MTEMPNPAGAASPPETVTELMRHFFGETISTEDPLLILGATPHELTEEGVLVALRRRLDALNASVGADSREADRMRLVLHAAAARLLGVLHRHSEGATAPSAPAGPTLPMGGDEPAAMVTPELHAALALGGGRREAMSQMARAAAAQGVDPAELLRMLRSPGGEISPGGGEARMGVAESVAAPARSAAGRQSALEREWDESRLRKRDQDRAVRAVLVFSGIGLVGILTIGAVVTVLVLGGNNPAPSPGVPNVQGTASTAPPVATPDKEIFPTIKQAAKPAPPADATARDRVGDFGDVLSDLDAASHGLEVDPEGAIQRFELAAKEASYRWVEAKPDALIAAMNSIVEFMYRGGSQDEILARALAALVAPGRADPLSPPAGTPAHHNVAAPVAWSAGVLTRLMRERDLPSARREQVRDAFLAVFRNTPGPADSDFRSGAAASLAALPERLIPPRAGRTDDVNKHAAQAWRDWADTLAALDGPKGPITQRLLLNALERLLTTSPEPSQDQVVFDAVSALTTRVTWRKGDDSRGTLLRWFDTPAISAADLHAVTSALATQSGAQGVDYSMVLSAGAGDSQRAELRDRFAAVWGLSPAASRDVLTAHWIDVARRAVSDAPPAAGLARLANVVHVAGLNLAAWKLRAGEVTGVKDLVDAGVLVIKPGDGVDSEPLLPIATGASWGVKYVLAGRSIPQRREILAQVAVPPNAFEADLIVNEAVRGSPALIRAEAATLVDRFASTPTIVNAFLRLAPFIPQTVGNTELVRKVSFGLVPGPRDPTWRVAVRRALVERLLQLAAGKSELAQVDVLAKKLAETYSQFRPRGANEAAAEDTLSPGTPSGVRLFQPPQNREEAATPEGVAAEFAARLTREASAIIASGREPLGLLAIERRAAGRHAVARGQLQQFAATQADIAETLAFICVAEQPAREALAKSILHDLDTQRRLGSHIYDQLDVSERAILRLWLLRFGDEQS